MRIIVTWHNANPNTIYNRLAARLQREPTAAEVRADVDRILTDGLIERAVAGKLPRQK